MAAVSATSAAASSIRRSAAGLSPRCRARRALAEERMTLRLKDRARSRTANLSSNSTRAASSSDVRSGWSTGPPLGGGDDPQVALLRGLVQGLQVDDYRCRPALLDLQEHGDVPRADGVDGDMSDH